MDNDIRPDVPKDPYFLSNQQIDQQWSKDKTEEPVLNKPHKHHRHHRPQMMHYDLSEDVQVIDDQLERIHMPSFKDFRDTMILHDFQKVLFSENRSILTNFEINEKCFEMRLFLGH